MKKFIATVLALTVLITTIPVEAKEINDISAKVVQSAAPEFIFPNADIDTPIDYDISKVIGGGGDSSGPDTGVARDMIFLVGYNTASESNKSYRNMIISTFLEKYKNDPTVKLGLVKYAGIAVPFTYSDGSTVKSISDRKSLDDFVKKYGDDGPELLVSFENAYDYVALNAFKDFQDAKDLKVLYGNDSLKDFVSIYQKEDLTGLNLAIEAYKNKHGNKTFSGYSAAFRLFKFEQYLKLDEAFKSAYGKTVLIDEKNKYGIDALDEFMKANSETAVSEFRVAVNTNLVTDLMERDDRWKSYAKDKDTLKDANIGDGLRVTYHTLKSLSDSNEKHFMFIGSGYSDRYSKVNNFSGKYIYLLGYEDWMKVKNYDEKQFSDSGISAINSKKDWYDYYGESMIGDKCLALSSQDKIKKSRWLWGRIEAKAQEGMYYMGSGNYEKSSIPDYYVSKDRIVNPGDIGSIYLKLWVNKIKADKNIEAHYMEHSVCFEELMIDNTKPLDDFLGDEVDKSKYKRLKFLHDLTPAWAPYDDGYWPSGLNNSNDDYDKLKDSYGRSFNLSELDTALAEAYGHRDADNYFVKKLYEAKELLARISVEFAGQVWDHWGSFYKPGFQLDKYYTYLKIDGAFEDMFPPAKPGDAEVEIERLPGLDIKEVLDKDGKALPMVEVEKTIDGKTSTFYKIVLGKNKKYKVIYAAKRPGDFEVNHYLSYKVGDKTNVGKFNTELRVTPINNPTILLSQMPMMGKKPGSAKCKIENNGYNGIVFSDKTKKISVKDKTNPSADANFAKKMKDDFSLRIKVNPFDLVDDGKIFESDNFKVGLDSKGRVSVNINGTGTIYKFGNDKHKLEKDVLNEVFISYDTAGDLNVYINGFKFKRAKEKPGYANLPKPTNPGGHPKIGGFDGLLTELAVSDKSMTYSQIESFVKKANDPAHHKAEVEKWVADDFKTVDLDGVDVFVEKSGLVSEAAYIMNTKKEVLPHLGSDVKVYPSSSDGVLIPKNDDGRPNINAWQHVSDGKNHYFSKPSRRLLNIIADYLNYNIL